MDKSTNLLDIFIVVYSGSVVLESSVKPSFGLSVRQPRLGVTDDSRTTDSG